MTQQELLDSADHILKQRHPLVFFKELEHQVAEKVKQRPKPRKASP